MTGSNHRVKFSYYGHQIPITGIADFLCLLQAGIASPSLFVLHSYLTQLLNKYIWHTFLSCFLSFHSNISPSPPKACWPPSSLFHYFVICLWHLCCPDSWNFNGLFAFSFPDLGLWVSSNLLNFFLSANSIPPLVYCLSLCLMHAQQITLVPWRWSGLNHSIELHQQI